MKKTTNRGRKVSLDSKNQSNLQKGRILCGCMAKDHRLINNCTACGKIACEQEGEGPCFFCGNPVFSPENLSRYEEEFKFQLQLESDPDLAESYFKAVDHKDKLLKWEENDVARKNVYDEDTDWYEVKQDVWATKEVRQHAIQKMAQIEEEEEIAKKVDIMNINFETGKIERQKVTVDHGAFRQDAVDFMKKANDVDPSKKKPRIQRSSNVIIRWTRNWRKKNSKFWPGSNRPINRKSQQWKLKILWAPVIFFF
jgi:hypothetical protein